jgi:hypothetical protein
MHPQPAGNRQPESVLFLPKNLLGKKFFEGSLEDVALLPPFISIWPNFSVSLPGLDQIRIADLHAQGLGHSVHLEGRYRLAIFRSM